DVLLPCQIGETLRTVFAGEDEVRSGHRRSLARSSERFRAEVAVPGPAPARGAAPETGHTDESRYRCSLPGLAGSRPPLPRSPVQRLAGGRGGHTTEAADVASRKEKRN